MLPALTPAIIITRPAHQAEPLAQLIRQLGANPLIFPTLEIRPLADQHQVLAALHHIDQYELVIFVSANAVEQALALLQPHFAMPVIAIGPGTARALQARSVCVNCIPESHHSEGLLALPLLNHVHSKRIAIFCGENSRPLLKQALTQRGARVDELACYRRLCPSVDADLILTQWRNLPIALVISTSRENLLNLWAIFGKIDAKWLSQIPLLVISPAMAAQAKQLGFISIITTNGASDEAIYAALQSHVLNSLRK